MGYIPRGYLNKLEYPNFPSGSCQRTPAKRPQFKFWRLHVTRTLCGQHAPNFFRPSTSQNKVNAGAQKVPSADHPILFVTYRGIPPSPLKNHRPPHFVFGVPFLTNSITPFCPMVLTRIYLEMTPEHHLSATPHTISGNRHAAICKSAVSCDCIADRTKVRLWEEEL